MEVVNNQKAQAKISIRNDLKSNVTNISHESNEIQDTIAMLNHFLGGSPMGAESEAIGYCQKALHDLSQALQKINLAAGYIDQLKTTEEIPNDES
jgi:hypothetical protein